jgi:hypothetical protein
MAGLYGSGRSRSSPDDKVGRRLLCKLSEGETGRRQGMHEPNAIWAVSVHVKGVVIWQESFLVWEVDVVVITRIVVVSPPLKGRVVVVQHSVKSGVRLISGIAGEAGHTSEKHSYPRKDVE